MGTTRKGARSLSFPMVPVLNAGARAPALPVNTALGAGAGAPAFDRTMANEHTATKRVPRRTHTQKEASLGQQMV